MTKYDIYGIALSCFNKDIKDMTLEATEDSPQSNEIFFLDMYYRGAEVSCASLFDWSFLYNFKQFTDDDLYEPLSVNGDYAYPVPPDFSYPVFLSGEYIYKNSYNEDIRRLGAYLIFRKKNPGLTYINDRLDFDNWIYPDAYGYLVAYRLAMDAWGNIAPDSKLYETTVTKYGLIQQSLMTAETKTNRKRTPPPEAFIV